MNWKYTVVVSVIAFVLMLGISKCSQNRQKKHDVLTIPELTTNQKEKVIIDTRTKKVTIIKKKIENGKIVQTVDELEGSRDAVITVNENNNEIQVYAPQYGWTFEPGIGICKTETDTRVVLDSQILYYKSLGINTGISYNKNMRGYIAISFNLPYKLFSNTSAFMGYDTGHSLILGTRLKF